MQVKSVQKTSLLTKGMVLAFALAATFALSLGMAGTAHAATVAWNSNVTVEADAAQNDAYAESAQIINVTMDFATAPNFLTYDGVNEADTVAFVTNYLQNNITIAGNALTGATYNRAVTDVAVNGDVITFKIGPNTAGMTANYNGKLTIAANSTNSVAIALAMGNAAVETLIDNGITINKTSASSASAAVFSVDTRAQARGMNHVLITDVINGQETAIFAGSGTFSNGGITIHSHAFATLMQADYAASIVSVGNAEATEMGISYQFVNDGNGRFSITNGGADCSNIKVYMYDHDYLNSHSLAVGEIWEPIWSEN